MSDPKKSKHPGCGCCGSHAQSTEKAKAKWTTTLMAFSPLPRTAQASAMRRPREKTVKSNE
jgi:hypothetical protein